MLKYVDTAVTFAEVPYEISLCINFSNCPCHCHGCHSSYLAEDIGKELSIHFLTEQLIPSNYGISCVCLMGGDINPIDINSYAAAIKKANPSLKVAWYSGRDELSPAINISNFDFIKIGHYNELLGPLQSPSTNQRFYMVDNTGQLIDKTIAFQN